MDADGLAGPAKTMEEIDGHFSIGVGPRMVFDSSICIWTMKERGKDMKDRLFIRTNKVC